MKTIITSITLISFVLVILACLATPAMAQGGGSISGTVTFLHGPLPENTTVSLVNASNVSEYIPGFNTTAVNGSFQFVNIPHGLYKAWAHSPYYADGYTNSINITTDDTYTASIVLQAIPYFASLTANPLRVPYGGTSQITATVTDYWGSRIGPGWKIIFISDEGMMNPEFSYTDNEGMAYSSIGYTENASSANITIFAIGLNGSSYPLQSQITGETPSPTPTPKPSATPTASPTVSPIASVTPTPTASPTASATPSPTPGFSIVAALVALGIILATWKHKR